jgi:hypothetical protein
MVRRAGRDCECFTVPGFSLPNIGLSPYYARIKTTSAMEGMLNKKYPENLSLLYSRTFVVHFSVKALTWAWAYEPKL